MEYNNHKNSINLTKEEQTILNLAIEEYKDLFPKILEISKPDFFPTFEKYLQISLIPKNIILQSGTLNKIIQIIQKDYYEPECERINQIIHSINNILSCEKYNGNNYVPHCNHHSEPIHSCGNKMFILDDLNYLLCLNCKKIYHSNFVLFHCNHCACDYYTSIDKKIENEIYKPATWEKYHCNAIINDVMKCPKCKKYLFINQKNKNLTCLKCGLEIGQFSIKWKCIICRKEFNSAAKIYNPYEFKLMKIVIKETIFNGKEAKPDHIPCCNILKSEIPNYKFYHKKECNGLLFEGELNNKKIIVCGKCHMLNFYEFHKWMCPKCKERFLCKNSNSKDDDEEENNVIMRKNSNLFPKTSISDLKKDVNQTNYSINKLRNSKQIDNKLYKSAAPGRVRGYSSNNITRDLNHNETFGERENNISEFNPENDNQIMRVNSMKRKNFSPSMRKLDFNDNENNENITRKLSNNININLNVNVNINNSNNNKVPYPYNFPKSSKNLKTYKLFNQQKEIPQNPSNFKSDDYTILSQIGEGTFGKIYQVEAPNKKRYAMKKILANSEKEINALESEYKMLLDLLPYHLNLVNIHGIETKKLDKTTYVMYVLMDLAVRDWEKEIIQRKAKKNYYSEEELLIILKELVHTFAELQRHKISHRDIKPQNILLFPDKSFRIADFGEAKELMTNNRATVKQTIRGTELYMSPILFHALQEKSKSKYTEHNSFKSDVFSLGLCLLFASTLTFNSLCDIRELNDTISMKLVLKNYLKRYSMKFTDILFSMLEIDEKFREDFVELEERIEYL